MSSNDKFIKKLERDRQKGKVKYILYNSIFFAVTYWVFMSLIIAARGSGFNKLTIYMPFFVVTFLGYLISLPKVWNRNEEKYKQLLSSK